MQLILVRHAQPMRAYNPDGPADPGLSELGQWQASRLNAWLSHEPIDYIIITNRDHLREAVGYQKELKCQLRVPEADASQMDVNPTKTYKDGELLPGGMWAIHLKDQKSPGESALFIERGQGVLIVGDALIGRPSGSVSLLPPEKYMDIQQAREGLRRLLKYNFDSLLVGDGASILSGAKLQVEQLLR